MRLRGARLYVIHQDEIRLRRQAALYLKGEEADIVQTLAEERSRVPVEGGQAAFQSFKEKLAAEQDTLIVFGDEIKGENIPLLVRWGLSLPGRTRFLALADAAVLGLESDVTADAAGDMDERKRHLSAAKTVRNNAENAYERAKAPLRALRKLAEAECKGLKDMRANTDESGDLHKSLGNLMTAANYLARKARDTGGEADELRGKAKRSAKKELLEQAKQKAGD